MKFTDENFEQEVLKSELPVMVDFWASWCPPCKIMGPVIEQLKEEYKEKVTIGKMNVDMCRNTAGNYGIAGVPTFILFKNGEEVDRQVGALSTDTLKKFIDQALE